MDSFEAQGREHLSQLETTIQPLLGQHEEMPSNKKGMEHLLESVVDGVREGYRRVEEQVRQMNMVGIIVYKCKNISIKMLNDVGMTVPKSRETRAVYIQQHRDEGMQHV